MALYEMSEGSHSVLSVKGESVALTISGTTVVFNLQTAEELIDVLAGYVEDRYRQRWDYMQMSAEDISIRRNDHGA